MTALPLHGAACNGSACLTELCAMTETKDALCRKCGQEKVFTPCLGCGMPVCETCVRFELIGSGCGCVWPAYYCYTCAFDPAINPNASFREPEDSTSVA
jgi:hypothetical protein